MGKLVLVITTCLIIFFEGFSFGEDKILIDKLIAVIYKPFAIDTQDIIITWYQLKNYGFAFEVVKEEDNFKKYKLMSNDISYWREVLSDFINTVILTKEFLEEGRRFESLVYEQWKNLVKVKGEEIKNSIKELGLNEKMIEDYIKKIYLRNIILYRVVVPEDIYVDETFIKGYHMEDPKLRSLPYSEVRETILKILKERERKILLKKRLEDIIRQYKIEVLEKGFLKERGGN